MSGKRTAGWAMDKLRLGQKWRRKRDGHLAAIKMLHRADGQAEMVPVQTTLSSAIGRPRTELVGFAELRRKWERVS